MAKQVDGNYLSREAGADLTGKQYHIVKQNSDGEIELSSAGTDVHLGTLQTEGEEGETVSVRLTNSNGTAKVVLGGAVNTRETELTADSAGKAVAASNGDWVIGRILDTGVSGDIVEYRPMFYKKA